MPSLCEPEQILRALLRTLTTCLVWNRERAEKIACLDFDNYRGYSRDPDEDERLAQVAFDDDVDHAEEVLAWRAVVVGHLVGDAMAEYASSRSPLDDPWVAWRTELPQDASGAFVRSLSEEEFYCARVAFHVRSDRFLDRPCSVPTDGDIEDVPGYVDAEHGWTWRDWLDVLGPPASGCPLSTALAEARKDTARKRDPLDSGVGVAVAELADRVSAFQMPTIERLESIGTKLDALSAPDRFRAEEFLKTVLGTQIYSSLSDDARIAALDAERRFRDAPALP